MTEYFCSNHPSVKSGSPGVLYAHFDSSDKCNTGNLRSREVSSTNGSIGGSPSNAVSAQGANAYVPMTPTSVNYNSVGDAKDHSNFGQNTPPVIQSAGGSGYGGDSKDNQHNNSGNVQCTICGKWLSPNIALTHVRNNHPSAAGLSGGHPGYGGATGAGGGASGSNANNNSVATAPVDNRTKAEKDRDFYKTLENAQFAAACGNPQPLKDFDKMFAISRPKAEYTQKFYQDKALSSGQYRDAYLQILQNNNPTALKNLDAMFGKDRPAQVYTQKWWKEDVKNTLRHPVTGHHMSKEEYMKLPANLRQNDPFAKVAGSINASTQKESLAVKKPEPVIIDDTGMKAVAGATTTSTYEQMAERLKNTTEAKSKETKKESVVSEKSSDIAKQATSSVVPSSVNLEQGQAKKAVDSEAMVARKAAIESRLQKIAAQRQVYGGTAGATSVVKDNGNMIPPPIAGGSASQNGLPKL
jgi:hypothetical protein